MSTAPFKPDAGWFNGTRVCSQCATPQPISEFPQDAKGKPGIVCQSCDAKLGELKQQKSWEGDARQALATFAAMFRGDKIEVPHTCELTASVFREFGGPDEVAKFIYRQATAAAESNPGGKGAMDACKLLFGMVTRSTEQRNTAPDLHSLDDETLQKELQGMLASMLMENPEQASVLIANVNKNIKLFAPSDSSAEAG